MPATPEPLSQRVIIPAHSRLPAIALAIYPATLVLGSLYWLISPTAHPLAPNLSSATTVTDHPPSPVNYFARKGNVVNVYFVKIGWLWTTFAFLSLLMTQPGFVDRRLDVNDRLRRIWQSSFRYVLVTLSWIFITQWCFGPAIIDRSFIATGGRCQRIQADGIQEPLSEAIVTAMACKVANGNWHGGHDVSGHAFMLVLASAFLVFELLGSGTTVARKIDAKDKSEENTPTEITVEGGALVPAARMSRHFVWAVAGLCWWMLLMTGIWFHTFVEKVR